MTNKHTKLISIDATKKRHWIFQIKHLPHPNIAAAAPPPHSLQYPAPLGHEHKRTHPAHEHKRKHAHERTKKQLLEMAGKREIEVPIGNQKTPNKTT